MAKPSAIEHYARMGAQTRLTELQAEIAEIQRTFPELKNIRALGPPHAASNGLRSEAEPAAPRRRRRRMTAAQRKAVGERMKKYWAQRRGAQKKS